MSNYKIDSVIMVFVISITMYIGISYGQISSISNSSSSCLSPQGIVNDFVSLGGGQIMNSNDSQLTGVPQASPSNNTHANNTLCNTSIVSSPNASNKEDFPKIFKSVKQSVVEVTAYNSSNHTIFKTGSGFIYNYKGIPTIITVSNLVAGKNDITIILATALHIIVI